MEHRATWTVETTSRLSSADFKTKASRFDPDGNILNVANR